MFIDLFKNACRLAEESTYSAAVLPSAYTLYSCNKVSTYTIVKYLLLELVEMKGLVFHSLTLRELDHNRALVFLFLLVLAWV